MNTKKWTYLLLTLGFMFALPWMLLADTGPTAIDSAVGAAAANGMQGWLQSQVAHYPWLVTVFLVIGFLRVIFKPCFALFDTYTKSNLSAEDYAKIQNFQASGKYKWLVFIIDLLGSIKLQRIQAITQVTDTSVAQKTDNKTGAVHLGLVCSLGIISLSGFLCWTACSTLEPGGAYSLLTTNQVGVVSTNVDTAFYRTETAFLASYQIVYTVCETERENRTAYWAISPDIKHTIDNIRPQAWKVTQCYIAARQAYIANPASGSFETMKDSLSEIKTLSVTANAALAEVAKLYLVPTNTTTK